MSWAVDPGHRERARGGVMEPDLERILAVGDVVCRIGMALGAAEVEDGRVREIARALGRGEHHRRPAIGLEAAVELAQGLGDEGRREVVLEGERLASHQRLLVLVRVLAAGERHPGGILVADPVQVLVAGEDERVELRGAHRAVRQVVVRSRRCRRRPGRGRSAAASGPGAAGTPSNRSTPPPPARSLRCRPRWPWRRSGARPSGWHLPGEPSPRSGDLRRRGSRRAPPPRCSPGAERCRRCHRARGRRPRSHRWRPGA